MNPFSTPKPASKGFTYKVPVSPSQLPVEVASDDYISPPRPPFVPESFDNPFLSKNAIVTKGGSGIASLSGPNSGQQIYEMVTKSLSKSHMTPQASASASKMSKNQDPDMAQGPAIKTCLAVPSSTIGITPRKRPSPFSLPKWPKLDVANHDTVSTSMPLFHVESSQSVVDSVESTSMCPKPALKMEQAQNSSLSQLAPSLFPARSSMLDGSVAEATINQGSCDDSVPDSAEIERELQICRDFMQDIQNRSIGLSCSLTFSSCFFARLGWLQMEKLGLQVTSSLSELDLMALSLLKDLHDVSSKATL